MYSEYFGGMLRGTSTIFHLARVRAVENNHAFADGEQTIYALTARSSSSSICRAAASRPDSWRVVDGRPYTFVHLPGWSSRGRGSLSRTRRVSSDPLLAGRARRSPRPASLLLVVSQLSRLDGPRSRTDFEDLHQPCR